MWHVEVLRGTAEGGGTLRPERSEGALCEAQNICEADAQHAKRDVARENEVRTAAPEGDCMKHLSLAA